MPDLDVVERNLQRKWRSVYRLLKGGQPFEVICNEMLKALVAQLREEGGIPALREALEAVIVAASSQGTGDFADRMRAIERRFGFSSAARGTVAGAHRLLAQVEMGRALPGAQSLAKERCEAGAGVLAEAAPRSAVTLVAIGTSSRLLSRQKRLLADLHRQSRVSIVPVVVPFRLSQRYPHRSAEEKTQRTRGFLFGSLAAAAAVATKAEKILVFENGVGAINLSLMPAQLGVQSTRSTHPVGIKKMARLMSALLQWPISFQLPLQFSTKAESCRALSTTRFLNLTDQTVSCDSFHLRLEGTAQCGVCTSCLLRRQALWEAGLGDDPEGGYRYDVLRCPERVPGKNLLPLKDMLWQLHRLHAAVGQGHAWQSLVSEFPALREVAEALATSATPIGEVQVKLVELYRRYSEEWARFPVALAHIARAA